MIKKKFQNCVSLFAKIAKVTGLIRLKVFYQLLIIISVMLVFLGIQAYANFRIINTMQKTTQNTLIDNSYRSNQILKLKQDITKLQTTYLETFIQDKSVSNSQALSLLDKLIIFDWMDPESKKDISEKLNSIKKLVRMTPSEANYGLLRNNIFALTLSVSNIEANLLSSRTQDIESNERFLDQSRTNGIIIMIVSSLLSIFIGLVIVDSISAPLKQIEGAAKALAVGDLTKNIVASGSPEILRVVDGLNQAIKGLRELVNNIDSQSDKLNNASEELKTASSETGKSAFEVARAMEEIAQGSSKQAEQVTNVANTVQLLSEMVKQVSDDTESIAFSSEEVAKSAQIGLKATVDVAAEIQGLYASTKEIDDVINELSKSTGEINDITSVIHGIAEQTSLLALNASIEAARAGEHGRGFAVVAQETGKLAEQSKQAAGLIVKLIGNIQGRTDQAVKAMQTAMNRVENGKNLANQTANTFKEINKSLNDNVAQIEAVAQSAKKMSQSNKEVIEAINEIAAISEESMASTEEVSATAQEQSSLTEQVAALSESLSKIANSLYQAVAVFEIERKNDKVAA